MHHKIHTQIARGLFVLMTSLFAFVSTEAVAKPANNSIQAIPRITSLSIVNGQLVASGNVTATIKRTTTTVPFSSVPVNIALHADQTGAGACPILDLSLGPIDLNLLGLVVETSPICLTITAFDNGGLLGDLLCSVANLLNGGLSLSQILAGQGLVDSVTGLVILPGLTPGQVGDLLTGLTSLFNGALSRLSGAILTAIDLIDVRHTCAILHLELGPLELNLLGLEVILDNCANGPVTVDLTAVTGPGNLLGNLLCELLDGSLINLGSTLQDILNQILGLLRYRMSVV